MTDIKNEVNREPVSRPPLDEIVRDLTILRQVSRPTTWAEVQELHLVDRLMALIRNRSGWVQSVGYAAIQIGIPLRMALYVPYEIDRSQSKTPVVLVNPVITMHSDLKPFQKEGCMSIPDQRQATWRWDKILVSHDLESGVRTFTEFQGFTAAVIQHEIDHMDGILNLERVTKPKTPGVNDACHCGSGFKFKRCCARKTA